MNRKLRQGLVVVSSLAALVVGGCGGSGGNNDQGIVFRAVGTYRGLESIELGRITCTEPTVENAIVDTSFTLDIGTVDAFPDRFDPAADPCGGYIGLENNLTNLAINVQEIVIRYEVPGAAIQVPDHSISFGQRIQPTSSQQQTTSGQPNLIYAELVGQLVPRTIIIFLNQNVNLLPETPYIMNAFITARGQSDTGENYETNEIGYTFTITF